MESTLHRQLKATVGVEAGGREEVRVLGYRIDAVAADGELVEIQNGTLAAIRAKVARLLESERVRIIKPVVLAKRIAWKAKRGQDPPTGSRKSPWRGEMLRAFDDLVSVAKVFPNPRLRIDLVGVEVEEVRIKRRRWPGHAVVDRSLIEVIETRTLKTPADLWDWIDPDGQFAEGDPFTTTELAERLGCSVHHAQKIAYVLRHTGAVSDLGKLGHRRLYARAGLGPVASSAARFEAVR